jgi:hypothetical protein
MSTPHSQCGGGRKEIKKISAHVRKSNPSSSSELIILHCTTALMKLNVTKENTGFEG